MNSIKFNRYNVTNGAAKARVHYGIDNRTDGRKCVTIYSKDYTNALASVFAGSPCDYENATDISTDYFEKGRVRLFETSPLYAAARAAAEAAHAAFDARIAAKYGRAH